jgi:4a-hydroxytetrahydrobiopterin dehydratase
MKQERCVGCEGRVAPLRGPGLVRVAAQLKGWKVVRGHHLARDYAFPDFVKALAFVNRVGRLAERVGHHPDLHLSWGKVRVEIYTHKINGLSRHDFVLAAKVDELFC